MPWGASRLAESRGPASSCDQAVERRPEDLPRERVRALRGVVVRHESGARADDHVALPGRRVATEPAPERICTGAAGRRVRVSDEQLDERRRIDSGRRKRSEGQSRKHTENCSRRRDVPRRGGGGIGENRTSSERLPERDNRQVQPAKPRKPRPHTGCERPQGRSDGLGSGRAVARVEHDRSAAPQVGDPWSEAVGRQRRAPTVAEHDDARRPLAGPEHPDGLCAVPQPLDRGVRSRRNGGDARERRNDTNDPKPPSHGN